MLLDTQILIWAVSRPSRLSGRTADILADRQHQILFSPVNVWEVAIKFALRRPDFTLSPSALISYATAAEFREAPLTSAAASLVADLPLHHRDPFDRLLVAQAIEQSAHLLTADALLAAYPPHVLTTT